MKNVVIQSRKRYGKDVSLGILLSVVYQFGALQDFSASSLLLFQKRRPVMGKQYYLSRPTTLAQAEHPRAVPPDARAPEHHSTEP